MENELSGKIACVIGVSPGIGRAITRTLAGAGARIACADLRPDLAETAADEIRESHGADSARAFSVDCTDRTSVRALFQSVTQSMGGLHVLVCVAAVFFPPDENGRIGEDAWRKTFDVNLLGSYLPADEARVVMGEAGGSIVLISSANAVVAKKGSIAYDTSKAALNHLVRELAVEAAPHVRVNGVAPASVVEGSLQFPRERVLSSLAKYAIKHEENETTEALREKLADFYARRTLLGRRVTPQAVADAVLLLAGDRLPLTTGHILPVDAGLPDAFFR